MLLIGNKNDLYDHQAESSGFLEKATRFAAEWGIRFLRISATVETEVTQAFESLIDDICQYKKANIGGYQKLTKFQKKKNQKKSPKKRKCGVM